MTAYGAVFWDIAEEVLNEDETLRLRVLTDGPFDFERILSFDRTLGGPGMHNVNRGRTGAYRIEDRDVFRPYQYCQMYFSLPEERLEWMTREIVHMCGLHLEELVERVAKGRRLTLGQGLRNPAVRKVLGPARTDRVGRFLAAYNASKHDFAVVTFDDESGEPGSPGDEHLFSIADAVVGYVVCRRLARPLYRYADLKTPRSLWSPFAGSRRLPPVPET